MLSANAIRWQQDVCDQKRYLFHCSFTKACRLNEEQWINLYSYTLNIAKWECLFVLSQRKLWAILGVSSRTSWPAVWGGHLCDVLNIGYVSGVSTSKSIGLENCTFKHFPTNLSELNFFMNFWSGYQDNKNFYSAN